MVIALVDAQPPCDVFNALEQLRSEHRGQVGVERGNASQISPEKFSGEQHYGITDIDVTGAALDQFVVRCRPTHQLTFLVGTMVIQELRVQLHRKDAPHIHVLKEGNCIRSAQLIETFFVTTEPGFLDDTPIRVLTGDLEIWNCAEYRGYGNMAWVHNFGPLYRAANGGDVATTTLLDGVPGVSYVNLSQTAAGSATVISGINGDVWAVKGTLTVRKGSTGADLGECQLVLRNNGDTTTLQQVGRWVIPEGDGVVIYFDTPLERQTTNSFLRATCDTLGPAGNRFQWNFQIYSMDQETHP